MLALGLVLYASRRQWRGVAAVWLAYAVLLVPLGLFALGRPDSATVRLDELGYFDRPPVDFALTYMQQLLGNLDPIRWLLTGDPNHRHHAPEIMGPVLLGVYCLALLGLYLTVRRARTQPWSRYLLYGLAVSFVPASLTLDSFHAHRLLGVPVFVIALTIPAQAWLLARPGRTGWRSAAFVVLAVITLAQGVYFQVRYDEVAEQRGAWFDSAYPDLLRQALATGAARIYLIDGTVPGYIHAYWYGATWGIPQERFVHLPRDTRAPPGAIVLSSEQDCSPCHELGEGGFYKLYRVAD